MYDTGAAIGENRSKEQKVTVTTLTSELTSMPTKIALQRVSPELRRSQAIAVIGIEWRVD